MNDEPRFYLSARRPSGRDDNDFAIANALEAAAKDPRLEAWVKDQARVDAAVAQRLAEIAPPTQLRERILAGAALSGRSRWQVWSRMRAAFTPTRLAALAALALFVGFLAWLSTSLPTSENAKPETIASWQEAAAKEVALIEQTGSTDPLDHVVSDFPSIRAWLTEQTCPAPSSLPAPVQKFSIFGCAKRHWQGRPLSIVCFAFPGGRELHLVTVDRIHVPNPPPERVPAFGKIGDYQTASWSEGGVAMMLIGKIDRAELQRLFTQTAAVTRGNRHRVQFAFAILR